TRRESLLRQPALAAGTKGRRRDRLDERIGVAPEEVQGPGVPPRDAQRPIAGERAIHVRGRDALRPGAHGEPKAQRILTLDRKHPLRHSLGAARRLPGKQLSREARREYRPLREHGSGGYKKTRAPGGAPPLYSRFSRPIVGECSSDPTFRIARRTPG